MAQKGLIKQDLSKELVRGKQAAFQYKPLEDTQLAWLARTENQRNYLESERKAKEQRDLRDNLAKIQALGLPKEMQGYLNSNVEDLINKVRNGEIDPESYDFRRMIQTISGEANQLNNINENLKKLAAEDKQVIIDGRDVSGDYKDQYISAYNTTYVPGTDLYNKFVGLQEGLMNGTPAIKLDENTITDLQKTFIDNNKNVGVDISEMRKNGFSNIDIIKEIQRIGGDDINSFNDFLDTRADVYLRSEYANAQKTAEQSGIPIESYDEYKKNRLIPFGLQKTQVTDAEIDTTRYQNAEKVKAAEIKANATNEITPSFNIQMRGGENQKISDDGTVSRYPTFNAGGDTKVAGYTVVGIINVDGVEKAITATTNTSSGEIEYKYKDDIKLVSGYKNESLKKGSKEIRTQIAKSLREYENTDKVTYDLKPEINAIVEEAAKDVYDKFGTDLDDEEAFQAFLESKGYDLGDLDLNLDFDDTEDMKKFAKELLEKNDQLALQKPISTEQSNQEEKRTTITFNADGSMNSITKPSDQSKNPTTTPKNNTQSSDTPNVDGEEVPSTATAEMRTLKYKNKAGKEITFEEDSKDFLTNIEVNYGGLDQDNGTTKGLPSYGNKSDTRIDDHLNSTKPLGKYFDGTLKKGLKADIGEDVYNSLSDAQKALLRMEHLNVGWNPKVLILLNAGIIDEKDRGKYHNPQKTQNPEKWDINKLYEEKKGAVLKFINQNQSGEIMADHLEKIYKGTDNSLAKNTDKQNELRNKGFQEQYEKRMEDIRNRYSIY